MIQLHHLNPDERSDLEALQKAYLYEAIEDLCQCALRNLEPLTFDCVYELTGIRKPVIVRLLQNDVDFHVDVRYLIQTTNDSIDSTISQDI